MVKVISAVEAKLSLVKLHPKEEKKKRYRQMWVSGVHIHHASAQHFRCRSRVVQISSIYVLFWKREAVTVNQELTTQLDKVSVALANVHNNKPCLSLRRTHHARVQRLEH